MLRTLVIDALIASSLLVIPAFGQAIDPRGPIKAYPEVDVWPQGVSLPLKADASAEAKQVDKHELWNPKWITFPGITNQSTSPIRTRAEFTLPSGRSIATADALVTADPFYRLWVNGHLVSRGPDDAGSDYSPHERWSHQWLANQVDVATYLHQGRNVIAAEVFPHHQNLSLGATAFAFKLKVAFSGDAPPFVLESGPDWLVEAATAYTIEPVTQGAEREAEALIYDARNDNSDWRDLGFSATRWSPAKVRDSIWGPIAVSALPRMMEAIYASTRMTSLDASPAPAPEHNRANQHDMQAWSVLGNGKFLVDYDRVLSGYISLALEGTPGTTITVWPRELRTDAPGRRPFVIILGSGTKFFESPALESFASLEIDVSNATGPVHFHDIRANFVSQPVSYRGSFTSSNERLNTLWKASRWQTQICLQNRFLDSPDHQEPIGDPGDYLIEAKVADFAFGPPALTPQFLREFAGILDHWLPTHPEGSTNFHTSYSLLWLQTLLDYYDETGDISLARELAPSAYRLVARYGQWIGKNGILSEAPNYLFMDWVAIGGFQTHHPPAVIGQGYLTAFYYRGLEDAMRLAQLSGDSTRVAQYAKQRRQVRKAFNEELWDARTGLYRDGKPFLNHNPTSPNFLPPDKDIETHSPHVNVLAVLYDLAPKEEQAAILSRVVAAKDTSGTSTADVPTGRAPDELNVQPYFMHFVFAAEAHAGVLAKYAPAQLSRWNVNPQTQTFQEMWGRGDWSHGWGGSPLLVLSSHVLGIAPGSAGYGTVQLAPVPLGLAFAKGTVPTPKGDINVSWTCDQHAFVYDATLPPDIGGTVNLNGIQNATSMQVSIDGSSSKPYTTPIQVGAGPHHIVLSAAR